MFTETTRSDRLAEAQAKITEAVEKLATSDDWRAMLETANRFHRYSVGNVFLITCQRPDATRVAGYKTWQSLGRQVRKGERGIVILAPCRQRFTTENDEGDRIVHEYVRGFTAAHVFDISQTDGAELPDVLPTTLNGTDSGSYDRLSARITEAGFTTNIVTRSQLGLANGRTDYADRTVVVADDLAPAQRAKTLAHELAHIALDHESRRRSECRSLLEVEAESVAYLVCRQLRITSDAYTFPYVARWAGGDADLVRKTADKVIVTARAILEALGAADETDLAA